MKRVRLKRKLNFVCGNQINLASGALDFIFCFLLILTVDPDVRNHAHVIYRPYIAPNGVFSNTAVDIFSIRSRTSSGILSLRRNLVCTYQYNLTNVSARAYSDFNRENGTHCNEYIKASTFSWKRLMQWHLKWSANHSSEMHPKRRTHCSLLIFMRRSTFPTICIFSVRIRTCETWHCKFKQLIRHIKSWCTSVHVSPFIFLSRYE